MHEEVFTVYMLLQHIPIKFVSRFFKIRIIFQHKHIIRFLQINKLVTVSLLDSLGFTTYFIFDILPTMLVLLSLTKSAGD